MTRALSRSASASTGARLALLVVSAVVLTGCTAGPGGTSTETPTTTPAASGACPSADASATKNPLVVTPTALCEIDGTAWTDSPFTFVINTPEWGETTPECDEARKKAYFEGWDLAAPAMETLDLMDSPSEDATMIGSVGISVIESPDVAAAIAALDAEGPACDIENSPQVAVQHGSWKGVRGPTSQGGDDDRWSWWIAADGRWAFVQAYATADTTDGRMPEVESAITTLLDAQESLL